MEALSIIKLRNKNILICKGGKIVRKNLFHKNYYYNIFVCVINNNNKH